LSTLFSASPHAAITVVSATAETAAANLANLIVLLR
jgi:hypothetical protein